MMDKPPLNIGDVVTARTGPRRLVHVGDTVALQRGGRRYLARVLTSENEHYRPTAAHLWTATRCKYTAEIIEH